MHLACLHCHHHFVQPIRETDSNMSF
uniref:Uncharacterized protein n=1 Tax=Anguilla anguilla TaxID=7936 RepID=A0A0E9R661_ANGAN